MLGRATLTHYSCFRKILSRFENWVRRMLLVAFRGSENGELHLAKCRVYSTERSKTHLKSLKGIDSYLLAWVWISWWVFWSFHWWLCCFLEVGELCVFVDEEKIRKKSGRECISLCAFKTVLEHWYFIIVSSLMRRIGHEHHVPEEPHRAVQTQIGWIGAPAQSRDFPHNKIWYFRRAQKYER